MAGNLPAAGGQRKDFDSRYFMQVRQQAWARTPS